MGVLQLDTYSEYGAIPMKTEGRKVAYNAEGRRIGQTHPRAKFGDEGVKAVISLNKMGYRVSRISRLTGMSKSVISRYISGSLRSQPVMKWGYVPDGRKAKNKGEETEEV